MAKIIEKDIVVIGAGPVGIFSAFQAGMLGMSSCIIDYSDVIGGQCSTLYPEKPIYDIPGYETILAQNLVDNLAKQAERFHPEYLLSRKIVHLANHGSYFVLTSNNNDIVKAKSVIIAAGAGCFDYKKPPLENIEFYEGQSVFYSISTKANLADKKIIIAGGGDSAIDWAIALSEIAEVTLVHRRPKFRAAPASVTQMHNLVADNKIKLLTNYQLAGLMGKNGELTAIKLVDFDNKERIIETDILLPFYGLAQNLDSLNEFGLELKNNHIVVDPVNYQTNIKGIYAVGDVATYQNKLKLILTGFAETASALHHTYSRIFDGKPLHFEYSTSKYTKLDKDG